MVPAPLLPSTIGGWGGGCGSSWANGGCDVQPEFFRVGQLSAEGAGIVVGAQDVGAHATYNHPNYHHSLFLQAGMYVCVYVYVCMYVYIYVCKSMYVYVLCRYVSYVCMYVVCKYVYVCMYIYVCICICVCVCVCVC